jgi:cell division protein FtsZ
MPNPIDSQPPAGSRPDATPFRMTMDDASHVGARIKVIGVGGGGSNAVNRMVREGFDGVQFVVANTDVQALRMNAASIKVQLGEKLTKGLGAGADPSVGRHAALEDTDKLIQAIDGADLVFVTAGLGGGTGTGAAPVIASLASELGALTIAVVTRPFTFEGRKRALQAERGLEELRDCVDSVITIPNERLLSTIDRKTPLLDAFATVDEVLRQAIQGISDLILLPGLINLDFADVKTILTGMGVAVMGTGIGHGETRAVDAARKAISSPLLEDASIDGARGVIINVTGGSDLSLVEVHEASTIIHGAAHEEANIIFGAVIDPRLDDQVKLTVIATGFDRPGARAVVPGSAGHTPVDLGNYTSWLNGEGASSRLTIARRHGVGVAAPAAGVSLAMTIDPSAGQDGAEPAEGDGAAGLEVPAFMRRVKQA